MMHEGCTHVCTQCIARFAPPPPFPLEFLYSFPGAHPRASLCVHLQCIHLMHTCRMHEGCTRVCSRCFAPFAPPSFPSPPFNSYAVSMVHTLVQARVCTRSTLV